MKKRTLSLLTVVCALCLVFFACRKEISRIVDPASINVSARKLEAAKIWNAKFIAKNITENSKQPGFVTLNPLWNQAWTLTAVNGNEFVAVPTALDHIDQMNVTISRLFLFEMKGEDVVNAQIAEFMG
ncbi:hypothetical protein GCM10023149_21320 [Mucilaginibacter gynuensis]|uniref:Uncharacterized protein n=1 Tax=Mucilaginibacter gynuensis TaxID=1302236 RepID=A0ABP8GCJ7_9SPHI